MHGLGRLIGKVEFWKPTAWWMMTGTITFWIWYGPCVMVLPFSVGSPFFVVAAFPMARLFFTLFDSASYTRIYGEQASIHNGKWLGFLSHKKSTSLRCWHLEPIKLASNVSAEQRGWDYFASSRINFVSRWRINSETIRPTIYFRRNSMWTRFSHHPVHRSSSQAQCNTRESCTSWVASNNWPISQVISKYFY